MVGEHEHRCVVGRLGPPPPCPVRVPRAAARPEHVLPMMYAPVFACRSARRCLSASRPGWSVSNIHAVSASAPVPNGCSRVWSGPAVNPSREMARFAVTMLMWRMLHHAIRRAITARPGCAVIACRMASRSARRASTRSAPSRSVTSALHLGHQGLRDRDDVAPAVGGQDELGPLVGRVGDAHQVAAVLEVADELGHGLLGHLRAVGEHAHRRPGVVQVLEHRRVGGAHVPVPPFGEPGDDQVVDRHERLAHEDGEVGGALAAGQDRDPP